MRDFLLLYVNGKRHLVRGADAFVPLSTWLRERLAMTGTKIVCSEGDCGACSVLVGRVRDGALKYDAIDSCIQFMHQLDGTHIVTVEGLKREGCKNAVQDAMVRCFGSQCGFCTPGFVVTMTGMLENGRVPTDRELRDGLSGNLCRCTGYVQILEAGRAIDISNYTSMNEAFPPAEMLADFAAHRESVKIVAETNGVRREALLPRTIAEAVEFKASNAGCTVVSGATDLGVQCNKGRIDPRTVLVLGAVEGLADVRVEGDRLVVGARATWTSVERAVAERLPQLHAVLKRFGSPQIRNAGTIGGNVINASPIADSLPFLYATEAVLELGGRTNRSVPIEKFYLGYKKLDLRPDELLLGLTARLPQPDETLKLYKISRRKDLDISTFTAAILLRREGNTIASARIAYGGVGPVVLRLRETESFLVGQPFEEETFREAGRIARTEITPISDVRGSADYRLQLAENIPVKFFRECSDEPRFATAEA